MNSNENPTHAARLTIRARISRAYYDRKELKRRIAGFRCQLDNFDGIPIGEEPPLEAWESAAEAGDFDTYQDEDF